MKVVVAVIVVEVVPAAVELPPSTRTPVPFIGIVAIFVTCVVGLRRFQRGFSPRRLERMRSNRGEAALAEQIGFALLPASISMGCAVAGFGMFYVYAWTDVPVFAWLVVVLMLSSICSMAWAFKELVSPSKWRQRPHWLSDL